MMVRSLFPIGLSLSRRMVAGHQRFRLQETKSSFARSLQGDYIQE